MSANTNISRPLLSTLPIDLIREIGSHLETPSELLDFACVCNRTNAAIDMIEMAKKDAVNQLSRIMFGRDLWRQLMALQLNANQRPMSYEEFQLTETPWKPHKPILLWAIETGKDIDYIEKCINVYRKGFHDGLEGYWFPNHDPKLNPEIYTNFPSPMFAAAKAGRLDVIQALLEYNVNLSGRMNWPESTGSELDFSDVYSSTTDDTEYLDYHHPFYKLLFSDNAFSAACEFHEDIALFMLENGYRVNSCDLWHAVRFGRFQLLDTLLGHPNFRTEDRRVLVFLTLKWATVKPIADHEIIRPLLDAVTAPLFDKAEFLRNQIHMKMTEYPMAGHNPKLLQLLNFYISWASPPYLDRHIVSMAACNDEYLGVVKTIFPGDPYCWLIRESEGEIEACIDDMLSRAARSGSMDIMKYLLSLGHKLDSNHFGDAIRGGQLEMVEEMLALGMPLPSTVPMSFTGRGGDCVAPIEGVFLALDWRDERRRYFLIFTLIYHGADFTKVSKESVYRRLLRNREFYTWCHSERANDAKTATPTRLSFANRPTSDSEYFEQLHAMATLILGEDYLEVLEKEDEWAFWAGVGSPAAGAQLALPLVPSYTVISGLTVTKDVNYLAASNAINAVSQVLVGYASDRLGRQITLVLTFLLAATSVFAFWISSVLSTTSLSLTLRLTFIVKYCFSTGGYYGLFPALIAEIFGIRQYAVVNAFAPFMRRLGTMFGCPVGR
ncbi:hypothetical protein F5Y06DRAFT_306476 [Hypoxylon sp. FL0890]|nr:hypothetical protein F5Y06DRAFT_306476 [Hypoxylon sp. FL0890]